MGARVCSIFYDGYEYFGASGGLRDYWSFGCKEGSAMRCLECCCSSFRLLLFLSALLVASPLALLSSLCSRLLFFAALFVAP